MMCEEEFDKMINLYQEFMIKPLTNLLERDKYDKIEIIHLYTPDGFKVRFGAIRTRPAHFLINKMYCGLAIVDMFDIERWYASYCKLLENSKMWKWEISN